MRQSLSLSVRSKTARVHLTHIQPCGRADRVHLHPLDQRLQTENTRRVRQTGRSATPRQLSFADVELSGCFFDKVNPH
jgi:hypothetical protein